MKKISSFLDSFPLSAILVLVLILPFVNAPRPFPLRLNILFVAVLAFVGISFWFAQRKEKPAWSFWARYGLLGVIAYLAFLFPAIEEIIARNTIEDYNLFRIHDGALQIEEALKFLVQGINPYATTYFGTALEYWGFDPNITNPALYHLVYPPFLLIFSIPFYLLFDGAFGFYDQRIILIFVAALSFFTIPFIFKSKESILTVLTIVFLNFMAGWGFKWGMNDFFLLFWLVLFVLCLVKDKKMPALIFLGLAVASKQTAWLILPFVFIYYLGQSFNWKSIKKTALSFWPLAATVALLYLPFFIWSPAGFWDSTAGYLLGTSEQSYIAEGIGFSNILQQFIKNPETGFPFWIVQVAVGLPVLFFLIRKQLKQNNITNMLTYSVLFIFALLFFGRYSFWNHYLIPAYLLLFAYFIGAEKGNKDN